MRGRLRWRNPSISSKPHRPLDSRLSPLSLKILTPTDAKPQLREFPNAKVLARFMQNHRGLVQSINPVTKTEQYHKESEFATLDPSRIYEVYFAFYTQDKDGLRHHQDDADNPFEDKSRLVM